LTSKTILIGSPNSGKSLLFNRLTGLNQKVANFPGITVNIKSGKSIVDPEQVLMDFPGVYSLHAISGEEKISVEAFYAGLKDPEVSSVVCVVDTTRLEKGLIFALQVINACAEHNKPVVIAANMIDVLNSHGMAMDLEGLAAALKVPVVAISAKSSLGLGDLQALMASHRDSPSAYASAVGSSNKAKGDIIASDDSIVHRQAQQLAADFGPKGDLLINSQTRLDQFFLHS